MTAARERILDAARDQIVGRGAAGLTLDGVAAAAGVSKGGLLYHFGSKAALLDGLAERLREATDANLARARREGVVRTFLETSWPSEEEAGHYWAVLGAVQSGSVEVSAQTRRTVDSVFEQWSVELRAAVADPVLADVIRLTGDGLYLAAVAGLPLPSVGRWRAVVADLVARAGEQP